jgi:hypothetical protein
MMLQRGRHTFDWGGEYQHFENNLRTSDSSRGLFRYSGAFTAGPDPLKPSDGTGLALGDFLLGFPLQASRLVGTPQGYMRRDYLSFYAGDTFRPKDRLSLTFGLRYEYFTPFREKRNNYYNLDFSRLPEPPVLVQLGNHSGPLPENGVRAHSLDFGPRFGIACRILPKVIVRTSYGVYFSQEIAAIYYNLVRNGVRTETNDSDVRAPQLTTQNAFNNAVAGFPSYNYIDPNSSTPYVQQWNLGVQWELPGQTALEAVYVGSKGTHLYRYRDWNNAYHVETGENLDPRPGSLQELRTFPTLGPILEIETSARSIYHALQLHLEKRFTHHFNVTAAFTWGKSIDDADVPVKDFYQSPGAQDERKLYLERGLSSFDVRKRFTAATIIKLPFGKGERWGGNGWVSSILGPWQFSSILTFQDGYPQDLRGFVTLSTIGGVMQRANIIPGQELLLSAAERKKILPTPAQPHPEFLIYNPAAVSQPGPYELGNAGRNILPTPGFANVDLSLQRIFPFNEKRELQIRADLLNSFNIVNLGIPIPNYEFAGFYGQLVTAGQMRSITLSLKFKF